MPKIYSSITAFFIFICLTITLSAGPVLPELTADRLQDEGDKLIADGDAWLKAGDMDLKANRISYDKNKNVIEADGNVAITKDAGRVVVSNATYDAKTRVATANGFRAGNFPLFIEGNDVAIKSGNLSASNTTFYYQEPDMFSLNAQAGNIQYLDADTILVEDVVIRAGKIPFFYIPQYTQRKEQLPLKIKADVGSSGNLGAFLQSDIFYTPNKNFEPGVLLDYYSKRGVLAGPSANYKVDAPNGSVWGSVRSGFIQDTGGSARLGKDILGRNIDDDRHFLEWKHKSRVDNKFEITGSTSLWSDSEVVRDFRKKLYNNNQQPDNFGEMVWLDDQFIVSFVGRFKPNDFQLVDERLPELTFTHLPTEVYESGVYTEVKASAARLIEKDPVGLVAEIRSNRFDYYHGFRRPIKANSDVTVTPVIGGRATHYDTAKSGKSTYTRLLGEVGLDAETSASRDWDVDDDYWAIHGLRHLVRPRIQYRYIPEAEKGLKYIPQIDRNVFNTLIPPIDLANMRNIDDMHELNAFRVGIENNLQTRADDYGSRSLAALNFFQDYNFSTRTTQRNLADFHSELILSPAYWVNLGVYNRINTKTFRGEETKTRLGFTDGDVWTLGVSTINLDKQIDQYEVDASYKFAEDYTLIPRWRYDARRGQLTEQVYGLRTYLGNSWFVEYSLSLNRGNTRDNDFGFNVRIELVDF